MDPHASDSHLKEVALHGKLCDKLRYLNRAWFRSKFVPVFIQNSECEIHHGYKMDYGWYKQENKKMLHHVGSFRLARRGAGRAAPASPVLRKVIPMTRKSGKVRLFEVPESAKLLWTDR